MKYLEQEEGIKKIVTLLWEGKLVPIFGAGFSMGCPIKHNRKIHVPGGEETTFLMNTRLKKAGVKEFLLSNNFNETSKLFLDKVPENDIKDFFREYFTDIIIEGFRKDFLALPWGYAYTLNVDDGIEKTGFFNALYPYKNARINNIPSRALFKLHGDAALEANYYSKDNNIVFSSTQYLNSITSPDNTTFIKAISSDYKCKNLLFIGCSLINEPDLELVYSRSKTDVSNNIMRIVIRDMRLDDKEEFHLSNDYGINTVVLISDYELFYRGFIAEFERINAKKPYPFQNPRIIKGLSKENNIEYFVGRNIFDDNQNAFIQTELFVLRDAIKKIEEDLEKSFCVIIKGRRLSGKSFIMLSLLERYSGHTVYYFPSSTSQDENVVKELFKSNSDSIFLFDSNSLTNNAYHLVANSIERIKKNNNKVVLAINSNDTYFSETLDAETVPIFHYFNKNENDRFFSILDKYSWDRRTENLSNIDFLELIRKKHHVKVPLIESTPANFSLKEQIILYILCVRDKIFYSEISALDISFGDVTNFISRMNGIVEAVPTTYSEKNWHCTNKLVCNSKYIVLSIVRKFHRPIVLSVIREIVVKLAKDSGNKRLYIDCCLFDTLNQIFGDVGELIFSIYKMLEDYVNDDMDYWLQRAKSIYRLKDDDYGELTSAYGYAQKAFADGDDRLKAKAALTLSLICCLLSKRKEIDSEEIENFEKESIEMCYYAINSKFTKKYVPDELQKNSHKGYLNTIIEICIKYYRSEFRDFRQKAEAIKAFLQE